LDIEEARVGAGALTRPATLGGIWRFCPDEGVRAYVGRNTD